MNKNIVGCFASSLFVYIYIYIYIYTVMNSIQQRMKLMSFDGHSLPFLKHDHWYVDPEDSNGTAWGYPLVN